jgi:hypothetical protein
MQHPVEMNVIDIPSGTRHKPHILAPRNRLADVHITIPRGNSGWLGCSDSESTDL